MREAKPNEKCKIEKPQTGNRREQGFHFDEDLPTPNRRRAGKRALDVGIGANSTCNTLRRDFSVGNEERHRSPCQYPDIDYDHCGECEPSHGAA